MHGFKRLSITNVLFKNYSLFMLTVHGVRVTNVK